MIEPNYIWHWETPRRVTRSHPAIGPGGLPSFLHSTVKFVIGASASLSLHFNSEFVDASPDEAPAAVELSPSSQTTAGAIISQLTLSCDVRAAAAAEINVRSDSSPMHDGRTWEQRRALTNGDSLVLEPTLTGRGPCDSGAINSGALHG